MTMRSYAEAEDKVEEYETVEEKFHAFLSEQLDETVDSWVVQMVMATTLISLSQQMDMPKEKFFSALTHTWFMLEETEPDEGTVH